MENIDKAVIKGDLVTDGMRELWHQLRNNLIVNSLPGELWKDVVGYEDKYEVSTFMRVRSKERICKANGSGKMTVKSRILSQHINGCGYWEVRFYDNNKRIGKRVHRIFTDAFYQNPDNKTFVNHKNLIKTDNIPCNLELTTPLENFMHAWVNGAIPKGEAVKHSKLNASQVLEIYNSKCNFIEIQKKYGITHRMVVKIKNGISWKSITNHNNNGLN